MTSLFCDTAWRPSLGHESHTKSCIIEGVASKFDGEAFWLITKGVVCWMMLVSVIVLRLDLDLTESL